MDNVEYQHMNEIFPGLWIGDMQSAKNLTMLQENNVHSVLSVMRGKVAVHEVGTCTSQTSRGSKAAC